MRRFVEDRVNPCVCSDVTTKELQATYYDYCEAKGWHPLPPNEIRAQLPQCVLERHRVSARHDIKRDGKDQRGFKNLTVVEG